VVASAHEARAIRRACGSRFLIVVPGIRPASAAKNNQARVATPAEAIRSGANYLVVGRPITRAADPAPTAQTITDQIASARHK
jgi:orotidine-5'-phosphate decarboxylase